MDENRDMKALAENLWSYYEPKIKEMIGPYMKMIRGTVTTRASGGVMGVTFPFDNTELKLPYASSISGAALGATVWVACPATSLSNGVVIGDGKLSNL